MDTKFILLLFAIAGTIVASVTTRIGYFGLNNIIQFFILGILLSVLCRFHRKIYIILKILPRDIQSIYWGIRLKYKFAQYARSNMTVMKIFRERTTRHPEGVCFIYEGRVWTNIEINRYSNQIASVFQKAGHVKGDVVALMMHNRPEYVAIWLGLGKLGVVTALINTNLRRQSLIHSLKIANAKSIIYTEELSPAIDEIVGTINGTARYKVCDDIENYVDGVHNLSRLMLQGNVDEPVVNNEPGPGDNLLYIYTSGTTGLPKAAVISNSRVLLIGTAPYNLIGVKTNDIMYNPNPLYHIMGGLMGTSWALMNGLPTVLRNKFSVTAYWKDCVQYNCTVAIYIGEMCRYLLNTVPCPEESMHSIRLMIGNGMKPQIWREFTERFKIKHIKEIYGSSEGNANLMNMDNRVGAIGFLPLLLPKALHPMGLIRVNSETYEPIRDSNGLCIRAETNEPGMLIGLINHNDTMRDFKGYVDTESSKKKVLENVFRKGDKGFVTGDILVQDEYGYLYFKDRIGDTFRWKGENVATAEVENIVCGLAGYRQTVVYGVQVPGMEGKAGMAAIVDPDDTLDVTMLAKELEKTLPNYARPIFLRIVKDLEMTGTLKPKKVNLQREGFNPSNIQDKLFFYSSLKEYVKITPELYQQIISGTKKF